MAVEAILNFVVTFMDAILIFISKKETFRYCSSFFEFKLILTGRSTITFGKNGCFFVFYYSVKLIIFRILIFLFYLKRN
jgi:uncharacterized membrane protein